MPSFTHGSSARTFLVDSASTERDISNVVTSVSLPKGADTAEVTALSNTAKQYIGGLQDSTVSFEMVRDVTVEGYFDGVLGALTTFSYLPNGSASTKAKFSGTVIITSIEENSDVGDANKITAQGQCSGPITRTIL